MLCKNPFIRNPKVTPGEVKAYEGARLDATPFGCGQCLCCRINQAREWVTRILLETLAHDRSVFVTLTYEDNFLPCNGELKKKDLQNFLKRLRNKVGSFRYFGIGEYGDQNYRPHYHLLLFGLSELNKQEIEAAWSFQDVTMGFVHFGQVNKDSARYVAGYTTSKALKYLDEKELEHIGNKEKEFMVSSRFQVEPDGSRKGCGIGTPGLYKIVESLTKHPHRPVGILRTIKIGGKEMALGRYLTIKLAEFLGVDRKEFDKEFWIHQESLFRSFMVDGKYQENLKNWFEPRVDKKEKKFKFFNKRKKL